GMQRPLPDAFGAGTPQPAEGDAAALVARFDAALGAWPAQQAELAAAAEGLYARAGNAEGTRRMYWVASAVAAALRDGALAADEGLRDAFAAVAAEARRQPADAAVPVRADVALEPARKLLYRVARAGGDHPALQSLRETFDLDLQATESEIAHAQGSLSGHNRALLDTVSAAIKEDLLRVKDALDLHVRTGQGDVSALRPQAGALGTIADTLGMLGLEAARNLV